MNEYGFSIFCTTFHSSQLELCKLQLHHDVFTIWHLLLIRLQCDACGMANTPSGVMVCTTLSTEKRLSTEKCYIPLFGSCVYANIENESQLRLSWKHSELIWCHYDDMYFSNSNQGTSFQQIHIIQHFPTHWPNKLPKCSMIWIIKNMLGSRSPSIHFSMNSTPMFQTYHLANHWVVSPHTVR